MVLLLSQPRDLRKPLFLKGKLFQRIFVIPIECRRSASSTHDGGKRAG